MSDISEPPVPLPAAQVESIKDGISLLPPLSRRALEKNGTPPPISKWAEEGYVVVEILTSALQSAPSEALNTGLLSIQRQKDFTSDGGVMTRLLGGILLDLTHLTILKHVFCTATLAEIEIPSLRPTLYHVHGKAAKGTREVRVYHYDSASSSIFAIPGQNHFDYRLESISHTRNLTFLKSHMQGPNFDLEAIWDEHTYYEFENRSVAKTMGTMVQEPYVNHIPTLTGGIGRERLTKIYRHHFIWNNPEDIYNRLISRTIGIDRICDEFIMELTHKQTIDWLLPGIPPTGKELRIPFVAIVNIRGDRLYHEHIMWDQASALAQCGLLPDYLPFPYPVCDANQTTQNKLFEYHLPVAGVDTAVKMMEKHGTPSNSMIEYAVREVGSS
ncbi:hypothetical protein BDV25DRAFT_127879 [Aspergillus avenaceus]|uniref:Carboxymethylenebutenolidase n=1 Tax=Aspergillus avenaceus TaxID=36643 RepID=A0A5N6U1U5_ASPAV|nr:hypothetical protein BDV25DRAFT_127879 [Aspergillus avenaceus]